MKRKENACVFSCFGRVRQFVSKGLPVTAGLSGSSSTQCGFQQYPWWGSLLICSGECPDSLLGLLCLHPSSGVSASLYIAFWGLNLMDYSSPGSSVHGFLQARILEWAAIPSSRGSSWPRNWTSVSCISYIAGRFFTPEPPEKPRKENTYFKYLFYRK